MGLADAFQCLLQVGNQVGGVFQADGEADEAFADTGFEFGLGLEAAVGGGPGMGDGGSHVAEVGGFGSLDRKSVV